MNVAVCICTCNRPAGIDQLLTALEHIDLAGLVIDQMEIIVVDNRPDGRARAICRAHQPRLVVPLHFCEEETRGISFARNRAIKEALGRGADFVAFLDDDDIPRNNWLQELLRKQKDTGAEIVTGIWRIPDDLHVPRHLVRLKLFKELDFDGLKPYDIPICATCNVVIASGAIERLARLGEPPFRPEFALTGGEDTDFFVRAHKAGAPFAQAKTSVVMKYPGADRATLAGALRQAFRMGCTHTWLNAAHLPAERTAKLRRRLPRRLVKSIRKLTLFSPPALFAELEKMAWVIGEIYGALGGRYAYYMRTSSPHTLS